MESREMTLDEYMGRLPPGHRAYREYLDLRKLLEPVSEWKALEADRDSWKAAANLQKDALIKEREETALALKNKNQDIQKLRAELEEFRKHSPKSDEVEKLKEIIRILL